MKLPATTLTDSLKRKKYFSVIQNCTNTVFWDYIFTSFFFEIHLKSRSLVQRSPRNNFLDFHEAAEMSNSICVCRCSAIKLLLTGEDLGSSCKECPSDWPMYKIIQKLIPALPRESEFNCRASAYAYGIRQFSRLIEVQKIISRWSLNKRSWFQVYFKEEWCKNIISKNCVRTVRNYREIFFSFERIDQSCCWKFHSFYKYMYAGKRPTGVKLTNRLNSFKTSTF
jgi:hypothetical protein